MIFVLRSKVGHLASATVLACALSAPAAATTLDFSTNGTGNLGSYTSTFTVAGQSITAYGFEPGPSTVHLWYKAGGVGEMGLGLADDPQHEVLPGHFITLLMPTSFSRTYTLTLDSLQGPSKNMPAENASIYECKGSTGTNCQFMTKVSGPAVLDKSVTLTLDPLYSYFKIKDNDAAGGENVLLESVSAVPLPAAAWLLLSGLGGLVMFGRRKRTA